ncbi:hypothetical protein NDA11_003660 [Ustilago hordei]|nr:hypothetical protein NDA10_005184 [Ustilago hordei]KAJ1578971.1 hypothetical protein NDA15_003177 [Ustilago hordei]KAJ1581457.1 hypothetical protein NDA11_003660 [Ustilago hordei]UTT91923.1 hypothetical protein NDA17_002784 [Ustilago hordei]
MSVQENQPKGQASVPPKGPGHDQMPLWKRMTDTSRRFMKRDPQLMPLAAITHETKASGRGSSIGTSSGEDPGSQTPNDSSADKGKYQAASGGLGSYLYPHLDKSEKEDLENVTVRPEEGWFGRTMKQAGVRDQKRKDQDFEERSKQQQDIVAGRVEREGGDVPAREKEHLSDLQGHKRTK